MDDSDLHGPLGGALGDTFDTIPTLNGGMLVYHDGHLVADTMPKLDGGVQIHTYGDSFHQNSLGMSHLGDATGFSAEHAWSPWDESGNLAVFSGEHARGQHVVGSPNTDAFHWQPQTMEFDCAVMAQRGIIEEFTGQPISEAQMVYEATVNGWLTDQGMSQSDVGALLELHGVDCHVKDHARIEDLMGELAQGHKVIVGVNSEELWHHSSLAGFFNQGADHAIWVTGVKTAPSGDTMVVINDSGQLTGAGNEYSLTDFINAWEDSGFHYVATDHTPPGFHATAPGFDESSGLFTDMVTQIEKVFAGFGDRLHDLSDSAGRAIHGFSEMSLNPLETMSDAARNLLFTQL